MSFEEHIVKERLAEGLQKLAAGGYQQSYHELGERHVIEADVLEQFKQNICTLEDLHSRLRFMMVEVQTLVKKI